MGFDEASDVVGCDERVVGVGVEHERPSVGRARMALRAVVGAEDDVPVEGGATPPPLQQLAYAPLPHVNGADDCLRRWVQSRAFPYVDDVRPVIARAAKAPNASGEVFNIDADRLYTVLDLAHVVAHAFGKEPNVEPLPLRDEVYAYGSHHKVPAGSATQPISLEVEIGHTPDWAKAKGARQSSGVRRRRGLEEHSCRMGVSGSPRQSRRV